VLFGRFRCGDRGRRGDGRLGFGCREEGLGAGSRLVSLAGQHQNEREQAGDARNSAQHADGELLRFAHELFSQELPIGLGLGDFARYDQQFILSRSSCG
jgi:hypothetical protein